MKFFQVGWCRWPLGRGWVHWMWNVSLSSNPVSNHRLDAWFGRNLEFSTIGSPKQGNCSPNGVITKCFSAIPPKIGFQIQKEYDFRTLLSILSEVVNKIFWYRSKASSLVLKWQKNRKGSPLQFFRLFFDYFVRPVFY